MFLGVLAFFLTLPPLKTHHAWVPLMVGLLAVACGVWAVSRGTGTSGYGGLNPYLSPWYHRWPVPGACPSIGRLRL